MPVPELSSAERKKYRGMAMRLKPVVMVGKSGVTPTVLEAVENALARDGLIKIRIEAPDKPTRLAWLEEISNSTESAICGTVGHTASLYRERTTNHQPSTTNPK